MTGKIAFDAQQPNGHTHIWVVDDQGVGPAKKFTEGGLSTQNKNPAWSSDGKRIAFVAHTGLGESQICVMDADGTNQQQLTSGPGIRDHPAWSPPLVKSISPWVLGSGNNAMAVVRRANAWLSALWGRLQGFTLIKFLVTIKIVYMSPNLGLFTISVMNADGTNQHDLFGDQPGFGKGFGSRPAWSPNGQKIAFTHMYVGTDYRVAVMNCERYGCDGRSSRDAAAHGHESRVVAHWRQVRVRQ